MRRSAPLLAGVLAASCAGAVSAQTVLAVRTLRAGMQITAADLVVSGDPVLPGMLDDPSTAIGMEARVTLYGGRPVPLASLAPPALIERNQLITLVWRRGGLEIRADARALGRGGQGDMIRVMNLGSRSTVLAQVAAVGLAIVP